MVGDQSVVRMREQNLEPLPVVAGRAHPDLEASRG